MRPEFHFAPQNNWMNDPNGLIYHNGLYHLYFQYNPLGNQWGHMSWGHATSKDLIHWEEHPVAIEESDNKMIFSGSAVFDRNNSSGLGTVENPPIVAIFTEHRETLQTQSIAYSLDGGFTYAKYVNNPVIDLGMKDFRDPKVFWYEQGSYWVMSVVASHEYRVIFYKSFNLIDWQLLSSFGPVGSVDGIWECPDLFPLEIENAIKWVLIISINPGGPAGGSGTQYFIGDFDGVTFTQTEHNNLVKWLDYGADYYAAVSYNDVPGNKRIMIGWMNNWKYAHELPAQPYRGTMATPREITLARVNGQIELIQQPIAELRDRCIDIQITPAMQKLSNGVEIYFDDNARAIKVKRPHNAFDNEVHSIPFNISHDQIPAQILIDHGSIEIFINKGEKTFTELILI
jgi:fructan beta-fructosidase